MHEQGPWLESHLRSFGRGRRLDVGCGTGRHLRSGDVGIDLDPARVALARARSAQVAVADARHLPFAHGTFGVACAARMLNDTGAIDATLAEIHRVLAPGGVILVYTRARPASGDRLDPANGRARLARQFRDVRAMDDPDAEGGVLFVAER